eukprot:CAMPEP_0184692736 /NCGR_PEP_ID=MMETSP0313-20130426/1081_1 /TAXON_ID=2792 /ORGANISM="Porphyridium aerugineum, Strain SAG 1380-2" /LENGTH=340 /DNA_ID=CAMNT_0027150585 /DNA_START=135 /DNA_END=1157 /DNA_ORIENTATION=-
MSTAVEVLDPYYLGITILITLGYQLIGFLISITLKTEKFFDWFGGTNFEWLALITLLFHKTYYVRQIVISTMVMVWGVRLSTFLFYRIMSLGGEDWRFDDVRNTVSKQMVFWLGQVVWVWTVSLPFILLNSSYNNPSLNAADAVSWSLWGTGFVFEVVADQTKLWFKNKMKELEEEKKDTLLPSSLPSSENAYCTVNVNQKWCHVGVWKYSRHPNYFGEILMWIGIFIGCAPSFHGDSNEWKYFSIVSPIFITVLILFVSGIPMLEQASNKRYGAMEDYQMYKMQTSNIIPFPPSLFRKIPLPIKRIFFFEWPIYEAKPNGDAGQEPTDTKSHVAEAANV